MPQDLVRLESLEPKPVLPLRSRLSRWIWPEIKSANSARSAAERICGNLLAFTGLALFGIMAAFQKAEGSPQLDLGPWIFFVFGPLPCIAWGIRRMSRTAAVLGLIFWLVVLVMTEISPTGTLWIGCLALTFVNGVRATFAYHRYKTQVDPAVSDTFA